MNPVVTIKLVDLDNISLNLTKTPETIVLHPPTEFQAV